PPPRKKIYKSKLLILLILLTCVPFYVPIANSINKSKIIHDANTDLPFRVSIPFAWIDELCNGFEIRVITSEERLEAVKRLRNIASENIREIKNYTDGKRDLIVILVESLTSKGITEESMPFCFNLTKDSTNIFVPYIEHNIGAGVSMDGQMITLSGQKPLKDYFLYNINAKPYLPSIQKSLRRRNDQYVTKLITITDTLFWSQPRAAKAVGINHLMGCEAGKVYDKNNLQKNIYKSQWLKDIDLFEHLITDIRTIPLDTPYIYTVITGDSHMPFDDDREPLHPITTYKEGESMYHYYISLQYTDREIERLFKALEQRNTLDNTTVLIVSDHSWRIAAGDNGRDMQMLLCNPINHSSYRPKHIPQQISIYPTLLWAMGVVDSTYMGLTPPMISPRIEEFDSEKFEEASYLSELIQYNNLLAE
ncbi:MAG: sulfatase-like hydrolase/transferase, partial [Rikenellaceae bacterium]